MGNCMKISSAPSNEKKPSTQSYPKGEDSRRLQRDVDLNIYEFKPQDYVTKDFFRKGASSSLSIVFNTKISRHFIIRELDVTDFGEEERNLVINEIKIQAQCRHENILDFSGLHRENMKLSILQEHMETNLAKIYNTKLFSGEHLKDDLISRVFSACIRGISYLNREFGVPHKDLRPNNILLNKDLSKVKLSGFGTFKLIERTDTIKMMDPTEM